VISNRDYFAWEAVFAVLAVPDARNAVRALLPTLPLGPKVTSIAESLGAEWRSYPDPHLLASDLEAAVDRLRASVTTKEFAALANAGRILEPDMSGRSATTAWAWTRVLRRWVADQPGSLEANLVARCSRILDVRLTEEGNADPDWHGLVRFAQGRLIAMEVRNHLVSLSDSDRLQVLEAASTTAEELGMPRSVIEVPTLAPNA
jgi:hypothetical protein